MWSNFLAEKTSRKLNCRELKAAVVSRHDQPVAYCDEWPFCYAIPDSTVVVFLAQNLVGAFLSPVAPQL